MMMRIVRLLLVAIAFGGSLARADVAFDAYTQLTAGVNPSGTHTPAGTPDCVLILAGTNVADTPAVTYGGVSMGSPIASLDVVNASEVTDFVFKAWLLGSGVPSGAQTVTFSSAGNGSTAHVYTLTTAANACEFITSASDDDLTITNVAATLTLGGRTVFAALNGASGEDAATSTTPLTNWTGRAELDLVANIELSYSYDIIGSTDITAGWTQSSDDAAFLAVAISESIAPATLSSPTPSGTLGTPTTATLGATTDQNTGTFYGVVGTGSQLTGVTASQIKAGQQASGSAALAACNAAVSTTSPSCGVTGLAAATAYTYASIQNNTNGDSNIVTGTFTTAAGSSSAVAIISTLIH